MAAPIYRDEFENRFSELVGYISTSLETQRIRITKDINANTDRKLAILQQELRQEIKEEIQQSEQRILQLVDQRFQANERMLRAIAQALNITNL